MGRIAGGRLFGWLTMVFLVFCASFAAAVEPVTVLEASGEVYLSLFADFSPTPVAWTEWTHDAAEGPAFDSGLAIPDTENQWGYLVHCGADGMVARSSWADLDPEPMNLFSIDIATELSCLVLVGGTVGLVADCASEGNLDGLYEHRDQTATIIYPDKSTATLLDAAAGTTHGELVLPPGQYRLDISSWYLERDEQDAMTAQVTLDWVDAALPSEDRTWSGVKALFR